MSAQLLISIGISGAGKSTFLKKFAEDNSYVYISPDSIREQLNGDVTNQNNTQEVWHLVFLSMNSELRLGNTVVIDATFCKKNDRDEVLAEAKKTANVEIVGLFFDVPLETALERNKNRKQMLPEYVLERLNRQLRENLPSIDEGFSKLYTINEHGKLIREQIAETKRELRMRLT